MKKTIMTICGVALYSTMVMAANQPSVGHGKEMFNSPSLGTNGKSCASCHSQGKGLEKAAGYDTAKLEKITNQCIAMALKGNTLQSGSSDLTSMIMYLKSLAPAAKP